ncbi:MAG TPA: S41 family peptidase [Candidatus Kapabacteria bacterium]|jgi:carboxyl-terminal processing protease|nr:S41 family peptidase [Candidatus Kapabacteria bacterium]
MKINISRINLLILFPFFIINYTHAQIDSATQYQINFEANKYKYILETIYQNYIDSVNIEKISANAYKKLLNSLDPQSVYYSKEEYEVLQSQNKGEGEGIGIDIVPLHDTLTIIYIAKNSPADSVGLKPGDKILFIDGKSTIGMSANDANALIRGDAGSIVSFIIKRGPSSSVLNEYKIVRGEYNIPSISAAFLFKNTDIAYILLNRFSQKSDSEFSDVLKTLAKNGMKRLIIDLRSNPGGYLDQVIEMLGNFLPDNTKLLEMRGRSRKFDTTYYTHGNGKYQDLELCVLIDRNSASASEIFAGVLQDYDKALIIGERSFGKGTMQRIWKINDGSGFRITLAEYKTPSGRSIQKQIDPEGNPIIDPALNLQIGEEQTKNLEDIIKSMGGKTKLPLYKTQNGRTIIGGGGVFPDIFAKNDTLTLLTRVSIQKGIFLEYVYLYLNKEKENILKKYKNDFSKFCEEFEVTDQMVEEYHKYSVSRNIWNDVYFEKDKNYIRTYLKSLIAYTLWDNNGFRYCYSQIDEPIKIAKESILNFKNILKK